MEAWTNWGWKSGNATLDGEILGWYTAIFAGIIPEVIQELDPYRNYSTSSPVLGLSWAVNASLLAGDSHYWGIWAGEAEFESYNTRFGRFTSEYGV